MSCFLHIIFTFCPFYRFLSQCLLLEPQMEQLQCRKERTPQNPYDRMTMCQKRKWTIKVTSNIIKHVEEMVYILYVKLFVFIK